MKFSFGCLMVFWVTWMNCNDILYNKPIASIIPLLNFRNKNSVKPNPFLTLRLKARGFTEKFWSISDKPLGQVRPATTNANRFENKINSYVLRNVNDRYTCNNNLFYFYCFYFCLWPMHRQYSLGKIGRVDDITRHHEVWRKVEFSEKCTTINRPREDWVCQMRHRTGGIRFETGTDGMWMTECREIDVHEL